MAVSWFTYSSSLGAGTLYCWKTEGCMAESRIFLKSSKLSPGQKNASWMTSSLFLICQVRELIVVQAGCKINCKIKAISGEYQYVQTWKNIRKEQTLSFLQSHARKLATLGSCRNSQRLAYGHKPTDKKVRHGNCLNFGGFPIFRPLSWNSSASLEVRGALPIGEFIEFGGSVDNGDVGRRSWG